MDKEKVKMKLYSSFGKRMLNVFFFKKYATKCWFYRFFWDLYWVIKRNNFLSCVECRAIVNRLINKYKNENEQDFNYYFSTGAIDSLMVDIEQN